MTSGFIRINPLIVYLNSFIGVNVGTSFLCNRSLKVETCNNNVVKSKKTLQSA